MTGTIQSGDTISVDYTGRLQSGDEFDSSKGKQPLKFTVGAGMMIKGFDHAVVGMQPGETKTVVIAPEDGYGPRNEELFVDIPRSQFPEEITPEAGMQLSLQNPQGQPVPAVITEVGDTSVRFDVNHFLAGKTLEFDITIVETGLEPDAPSCGAGCDCNSGCNCAPSGNCGSGGCS